MFGEPAQLNIVFFGTPGYAVPALEQLAARDDVRVSLVVTQPDRPAGRGRQLQASAVKLAAERLDLPVYQPGSLRSSAAREPLEDVQADLFVVAAYGLIFGRKTLAIPRIGCINLHASLLPKYRGASPITAAILAGDPETGVTLMCMNEGMDTGDIVAMTKLAISPGATTGSLTPELAEAGAQLLAETLVPYASGEVTPVPQGDENASVVRPLVKADGWIDWDRSAIVIERQVRAMQPWPRAWTTLPNGTPMQIELAVPIDARADGRAGRLERHDTSLAVVCGDGLLRLEQVQPAGASAMPGIALVHGRKLAVGDVLGREGRPKMPPPLIQKIG